MTLRDERDTLLDELGQYGRIDVTEDATGFCYVDFEGVRFIDDHKCYNMGLNPAKGTGFYTPYWPQQSDLANEKYVPVFRLEDEISTEMNTDVGGIKSKLLARGNRYGVAADLETEKAYSKVSNSTVMEVEAQIDTLFPES